MKGVTRKIMVPVLLGHLVGVLAIVLFTIVAGDRTILTEFFWDWLIQTTIVTWIEYFIPLTVIGLILGFSVFISAIELRSLMQGEHSFIRLAGKSVVLILLISVGFVALTGFGYGAARQKRDTLHAYSTKAHEYFQEAQAFEQSGQTSAAIASASRALSISSKYLAAIQLRDRLLAASHQGTSGEGVTDAGSADPSASTGNEATSGKEQTIVYSDNLKRAQEFMDSGDFYSALFFIRKASDMAERIDPALVDMRTAVEKKIRGNTKSEQDTKKRLITEAKQKAIIDYLGNNQPVEAYYKLLEIEELSQNGGKGATPAATDADFHDPDVRRWMPVVLSVLEKDTFFTEEAEELVAVATGAGLMFLNSDVGGIREYVYAQALMHGRFNEYLLNPEIITVDKDGKILTHRVSGFGKVTGANLMLKSISRTNGRKVDEATVLSGQVDPDTRNVVRLSQSTETLWNLAQSRFGYQNMSYPELMGLLNVVPKAGYDTLPLHSVLLGYFLQVLSLPSLCFFAIGWGWANRNRYLTRPFFLVVLMLAAVPVLSVILLKLYQFLGSCLNSSLLILTGFETALIILVLIQAVQLTVSLIYVAGQSVD